MSGGAQHVHIQLSPARMMDTQGREGGGQERENKRERERGREKAGNTSFLLVWLSLFFFENSLSLTP
jgi:hypothetical protein